MAAINSKRVWLGGAVGFVVWAIWSFVVNSGFRVAGQQAGWLLSEPRYGFFLPVYFLALLLVSVGMAWLYASVRATQGPGPKTALKIGVLVGFAAGFPSNFVITTWFPLSRIYPLWWTLELWLGAILAALVAGWLYKEA